MMHVSGMKVHKYELLRLMKCLYDSSMPGALPADVPLSAVGLDEETLEPLASSPSVYSFSYVLFCLLDVASIIGLGNSSSRVGEAFNGISRDDPVYDKARSTGIANKIDDSSHGNTTDATRFIDSRFCLNFLRILGRVDRYDRVEDECGSLAFPSLSIMNTDPRPFLAQVPRCP